MNQQCKVCGEPAAGFHFGAFTCEGCKSFFGRTYNNLGSISECKNGGVCVINKKNRTACKACRLRKCLMVGMSKSGSRYGRRSNWFKIHCLLQEQTNGSQNVNVSSVSGSPFGPGFLPGFLPQAQTQSSGIYGKDEKDRTVQQSQEDLALHSHILQMAVMKHDRNKSPHPDDLALQNQLRMLAWTREREARKNLCTSQDQSSTSPPRDRDKDNASPAYSNYKQQHPQHQPLPQHHSTFVNFSHKEIIVSPSPPDVFRPFLPTYKRTSDTPSDSGASSSAGDTGDGIHDAESRSNSALSYFKTTAASPTLSEREFPPRKINATVTLTTGYHPHQSLGMIYPPTGLVTPATSQHSPRGGDLLLVSPSPGGLAVEQDEPIDLSVRSSKNSPKPSQSVEEENNLNEEEEDADANESEDRIQKGPPPKSKPLDLTLGVKRPAEVSLTL